MSEKVTCGTRATVDPDRTDALKTNGSATARLRLSSSPPFIAAAESAVDGGAAPI